MYIFNQLLFMLYVVALSGHSNFFHEWLYNNDSMLNGFRVCLVCWWCKKLPIVCVKSLVGIVLLELLDGDPGRFIEQSSGSSSESSPTTSICISSSSKSDSVVTRCWAKYSLRNASMLTEIPLARNLRAWRSRALAIFFRRRALFWGTKYVRLIWVEFSD